MGELLPPLCDFCGLVRAVVYCPSDSARLCLRCDGVVHSANCFSLKHFRSPLWDNDGVFLPPPPSSAAGCSCCSGLPEHRRFDLNLDGGYARPFPDFSRIWSFSSGSSGGVVANTLNDMASRVKLGPLAVPPPSPPPPPPPPLPSNRSLPSSSWTSFNKDHMPPFLSQGSSSTLQKSGVKDIGVQDNEYLCGGGVDDIDGIGLNFDIDYEILDSLPNQPRLHTDDGGGVDALLTDKSLSVTESNSPLIDTALEASSSVQQECSIAFQPPNNCMLVSPNVAIGYGNGNVQVPTSISLALSNITRETTNTASEYQDCGLSPLFLTGESSWDSNFEPSCPHARDKAKMRYNEKKKTRTSKVCQVVEWSAGPAKGSCVIEGMKSKTDVPTDHDVRVSCDGLSEILIIGDRQI